MSKNLNDIGISNTKTLASSLQLKIASEEVYFKNKYSFCIWDNEGNFVCLLPKFTKKYAVKKYVITQKFGFEQSLKIMKELLENALKTETDNEIIALVKKRLKSLEVKEQ